MDGRTVWTDWGPGVGRGYLFYPFTCFIVYCVLSAAAAACMHFEDCFYACLPACLPVVDFFDFYLIAWFLWIMDLCLYGTYETYPRYATLRSFYRLYFFLLWDCFLLLATFFFITLPTFNGPRIFASREFSCSFFCLSYTHILPTQRRHGGSIVEARLFF